MRALLLTAALVSVGVTHAQTNSNPLVSTLGVSAVTERAAGQLTGCSINFKASTQDWKYRQGALVIVDGSLSLHLTRVRGEVVPGFLLKVGTRQIMKDETEAPNFAYIQTKTSSSARSVHKQGASESKGYTLYVLKFDEAMVEVMADLIAEGKMQVGFNRTPNGSDVVADVDMRVVDAVATDKGIQPVRDDKAHREFMACFAAVADSMKK